MLRLALISCSIEEGPLAYPLGALCILSAIRHDTRTAGMYDISLVRFLADTDDPKAAAKQIAGYSYDIVGLSVYLYNREWMDTFASELRLFQKDVPVFAGGPEAVNGQSLLDSLGADFIIVGEGEETVVQTLERLPEHIGSSHILFGEAPDTKRLFSPLLEHDVECTDYQGILWEMTRGCPYRCAFCFEGRGNKSVRPFPLSRLQKELDLLVQHEVKEIFVLDPTFNMDKERTTAILDMLIEQSMPDTHFTFEIRAELLDESSVKRFSSLYCSLQIGLQSCDVQVCKHVGRNLNPTLFKHNIELLNRYGVVFGLDLIIGLPDDTLEGFHRSIDFAISLKPSNIDIFLLSLLPGTPLASQGDHYGLRWEKTSPYSVLSTPTMDEHDIAQALQMKEACDLLYTKGEAAMWFNCACSGLDRKPSEVLKAFTEWNHDETLSVFDLQDAFISYLYTVRKLEAYLPALRSFMELHQGIAYMQNTGDPCIVELHYDPDTLALLDTWPLARFCDRHKSFDSPAYYQLYQAEDGMRFEQLDS